MRTTKKSDIYGIYFVRFYADGKHVDSLPIFAEDIAVVNVSIDTAPNVPAGTAYDVYFIGRYNASNHTVTNRCRPEKLLSSKKVSNNHSKAAEAATPERKEERKAEQSVA